MAHLRAVNAGERLRLGDVAAEAALQRRAHLADGRARPRRLDGGGKQVRGAERRFGQGLQRRLDGAGVALGAQLRELGELLGAHGGGVDLQHLDLPRPDRFGSG